jgi:hypothetical protein
MINLTAGASLQLLFAVRISFSHLPPPKYDPGRWYARARLFKQPGDILSSRQIVQGDFHDPLVTDDAVIDSLLITGLPVGRYLVDISCRAYAGDFGNAIVAGSMRFESDGTPIEKDTFKPSGLGQTDFQREFPISISPK